jgi:coronin-1B/1C/6
VIFHCFFVFSGEIEEEALAHEGNKASRAIYLKNGLVFTTGFTKQSERQYSLRAPGHLDDPIVMVELDTSNGVMFPMYDPDANLVYLCGKVRQFVIPLLRYCLLSNILNRYVQKTIL